MKLHDARLDDFLNIGNVLSTEDTRTPATIASDIKDAEDKESEQSSSSDDNDLQKLHRHGQTQQLLCVQFKAICSQWLTRHLMYSLLLVQWIRFCFHRPQLMLGKQK